MVEIWTPTGYVDSFEEWKRRSKSIEKLSVYPAYVPTINQDPYGTLFRKYGFVFGSNEKPTDDNCGAIYRKIQCSSNALHAPSFRHTRCNDPGCPVCYVKFASRMADRATERVQGFKTVYRKTKPYHLIFWGAPRAERPYASLREAFAEARRLLKLMGAVSATVWYHPYRIRKELKGALRRYRRAKGLDGRAGFWKLAHDDVLNLGGLERYLEYGPHWHAIATGYLMDSKEYSEKYQAGYKKKRYLEHEREVHEVAHYISTHARREAGRASVRYFGDISYRMLARDLAEEKIVDVRCLHCGASLHEFDCGDTGVVFQKVKDNITEKIKYFLYWKKGTEKPQRAGNAQNLITRYNRDTGW